MGGYIFVFFFSSRRRHTRCALVTGVQTCALPISGNWLVGLPPEYLGEYVPKIRAVNAAQVQAMARKYYDPENQSIVVVGDAAAVAEQLKPNGDRKSVV